MNPKRRRMARRALREKPVEVVEEVAFEEKELVVEPEEVIEVELEEAVEEPKEVEEKPVKVLKNPFAKKKRSK